MATAPSPTPDATRLTEPWRTSPTTKMPGTLDSRSEGSRSIVQPCGRLQSSMRAERHTHFFGVAGEIDGGLPGGICAADDVDDFAFAGDGFGNAAAVVNARAAETLFAGDAEVAPLDAHGEEQGVTGDFAAVGHFDDAIGAFDADAGGFLRRKNCHAEASGFHYGAAGEVASTEAGGKAEIIFDAGAEARLAARGFAFDHDRAEAFGSAVNGGGEAGGAATDDGEVVKFNVGVGAQADFFGDVGGGGFAEFCAVGKNHQRQGF